ncbi:MAG: hypothetical protein BAA01_07410 [Bacillus thermozeamaize]|jgi:ABC-2 type transport system ATP-binding protein|uniref:ABC transporter domain-containing protein n=1 Tax=Bacillus thermozeamaize TaxID=230954 RepID=A0A1Y3PXF7_9BACI|nr:MAG: hypothetical protein BAA01_07410 [Bacillus thermozeamaize]
MKQKLAIAQAIMEAPDLILLDEATNGLDEEAVENLYRIVRQENERGATILKSLPIIKRILKPCVMKCTG